MSASAPCRVPGTQTGMVLLLCLIFLMALTLLGLSASADTILQSKLASNLQETERAKQSALLALSWAEDWLLELDGPAPGNCSGPCDGLNLHAHGELPPHPEFENFSWWLSNGHEAGIDPLTGDRIDRISGDSFNTPVWVLETVKTIQPSTNGNPDLQVWYRILARGSGRTANVVSVIESTLVRSWPIHEDNEIPVTDISDTCPGAGLSAKCGRVAWRELH